MHLSTAGRRRLSGAALAAPALVLFGLFGVVPLIGVVVLSFAHWNGLGAISVAGLGNWRAELTQSGTWDALWLSVKVMLLSWVIQTPVALALGIFQAPKARWRSPFAALFFLPLLLSSVAIGLAWQNLLDPSFGLGSEPGFGWLAKSWLGSPSLALYTVIVVIAWQFVPFHALLYMAGVRQIPAALYEAAAIDGASSWQRFAKVTIPQLRYTIVTSTTFILVGSLTYFDLIYVLTGGSGGPGTATLVLPMDMYVTGFTGHQMGAASVLATLLVAVGLGIGLLTTRLSGFTRMRSQQEGL